MSWRLRQGDALAVLAAQQVVDALEAMPAVRVKVWTL